MRENLVFCSTASLSHCVPELFGDDRTFDVCVHFYNEPEYNAEPGVLFEWGPDKPGVWHYYQPGEKLETAAVVIPLMPKYRQYAFLDDDLTISTDTLNRLFMVGEALRLPLYQPALTRDSYGTHRHLWDMQSGLGDFIPLIRRVPFIEIMCPFFSAAALELCLPTFDLNISGWGLDLTWPRLLGEFPYVIDRLPVGHYHEPARRDRILRSGLTPKQELWIIKKIYDLPCDFLPPPCPTVV